uniref:PiggyBac transposable element-derived protein domain-containing protein n=1 Tax=Timema monikensis TaxID=170555 RepID=A0A7R9HW36_9NEOP|nr:unnamed protein product [Timema monikensis]
MPWVGHPWRRWDWQVKYLKKLEDGNGTGSEAKSTKKYVYCDQLGFLKKNTKIKEITSIVDNEREGPPENPLLSDEDSEDEDFINPDINHLSGNQLCATAGLHAKHLQDTDANVSIDEVMVPNYGRHGAKQHIHGKPIRFGYKVWCLCSRLGYLVQGEPYQGASTWNTHPELGVGGSVVIDLVDKLPHGQYSIYIDNFFTSVRPLEELKSKGHYCTGTIRSNRIEKASLEEASTLKKKVRSSYSQLTDTNSGITLIRYHDNSIVTVASTLRGAKPIGKARRWSLKEKKRIQIEQPACIIKYNCYMGGVDRLDQPSKCTL